MTRSLSAAFLATILALTPMTANPARADKAGDIAAAAVISGLIIYGLSQSGKSKKKTKSGPKPDQVHAGGHTYSRPDDGHSGYPSHHNRVLPLQCLHALSTQSRGPQEFVVSDRCLQRVGYRGRFPHRCASFLDTNKGKRPVYRATCLMERGYLVGGGY